MTPALRLLTDTGIPFTSHSFVYEEKGGTAVSSREIGVDEHLIIKTLIMETDAKLPLIVLMHGDRKVSTKDLARFIGVKSVAPCLPETAEKHSGYQVGGTSPFATRKPMTVYLEKSILELEVIYINGGRRGLILGMKPQHLVDLLKPQLVQVARSSP